jgi:hypothetical protein
VELLLTGLVTPSKDAIDTWYRPNTATILGAALTAEKKYAERQPADCSWCFRKSRAVFSSRFTVRSLT